MDSLKKAANIIADIFQVALALVFVAIIVLSVCHATNPMSNTTSRSSFANTADEQRVAPRDQTKPDNDLESALHSGEWDMFMFPQGP
jgi:hypothetical protein